MLMLSVYMGIDLMKCLEIDVFGGINIFKTQYNCE